MTRVVVVGSFNVDHVWRCEALPAPGATLAGAYTTGKILEVDGGIIKPNMELPLPDL